MQCRKSYELSTLEMVEDREASPFRQWTATVFPGLISIAVGQQTFQNSLLCSKALDDTYTSSIKNRKIKMKQES